MNRRCDKFMPQRQFGKGSDIDKMEGDILPGGRIGTLGRSEQLTIHY